MEIPEVVYFLDAVSVCPVTLSQPSSGDGLFVGMTGHALARVLKVAAARWSDHSAPRLGASLACYTLLSIAPLVVLTVGICGLVFRKSAEQKLIQQIAAVAGYSSAKTVKTLLDSAHHANGPLATALALVILLFGASGVFVELRSSLNTIWDAPPSASPAWRDLIGQRLVSFAMVLALGFLLLVSLLVSALITMVEKFFAGVVPLHFAIFGEIVNFFLSLAALAILFALIFKFVPDVPIYWRDVGIGAVATAVLFTVGKGLLGLYLGTAGVGSTYGAAGSLVALVVWVYYSAQIFFFGAVFTRVYADTLGSQAAKKERTAAAESAALPGTHPP